jgi:hypothetical protein
MATTSRWSLRRLRTGLTGMLILAIGFVLLPLPGPGTVVLLLGLTYLRRDYPWADRALARVRGWSALAAPSRFVAKIRRRARRP